MGIRTVAGLAIAAAVVAVPVLESVSQDSGPGGTPPRLNAQAVDVFGPPMPAGMAAAPQADEDEDIAVAEEEAIVEDEIVTAAEEAPAPEAATLPEPVATADAAADEAAPAVRIVGSEASAEPYLVTPVRETATIGGEPAPALAATGELPAPVAAPEVDAAIVTASLPEPVMDAPMPRPAHERPVAVAAVQPPSHHDVDYGEIFYGDGAVPPPAHAAVPPQGGNIFLQDWVAPNVVHVQPVQPAGNTVVHVQSPVRSQQPDFNYVWEQQGVWHSPAAQIRSRVNYGDLLQQMNRTVHIRIGG